MRLLVVRPQAQYFHYFLLLDDLIHQAMLDSDAAGIGPREVTDQFLVWRWVLIRIVADNFQERLGVAFTLT